MRVLLTSTSGAGHFRPLVPFLEALERRGDEVLAVVPPALAGTVAGMDCAFRVGAAPPEAESAPIFERFPLAPPQEAAVLMNREFFGRLCTAAMLPAVEAACREWQPDYVLRDPCEYAAAISADRLGIPHAQVGISQSAIEDSALRLVTPALEPYGDRIVESIRAAPYLTRFPASVDPSPFPDTRRFRETAVGGGGSLPDWWSGSRAPLVYVTFGTVAGGLPIGAAAYAAALEAVAELDVRVLLTVGPAFDATALGQVPANTHVEAWVPQADVLASAALVVCHGGSGTVFGALAAAVPLVVVPLFADQPANARVVAAAGAGLVVKPRAGTAHGMAGLDAQDAIAIREAVEAVLGTESYRAAAGRIAEEIRGLPAVDRLLATLAPA